jgi:hypothetical protein
MVCAKYSCNLHHTRSIEKIETVKSMKKTLSICVSFLMLATLAFTFKAGDLYSLRGRIELSRDKIVLCSTISHKNNVGDYFAVTNCPADLATGQIFYGTCKYVGVTKWKNADSNNEMIIQLWDFRVK